jgi:hypothetical protein
MNMFNYIRTFTLLGLSALMAPLGLAIDVQVQGINQLYACGPGGCGGNFQGMIGGTVNSSGNLTGGQIIQLMCIDYQNETYLPSTVYQANVSSIWDTNSDISKTRFGGAPNPDPTLGAWGFTLNSINYSGGALNITPDSAGVLARYQMVGYLASQYNKPGANNNTLQSSIWQLMSTNPPNPGGGGASVPVLSGSATLLSQAAQWHVNSTAAEKQALLSNFRVVTNYSPQIAGPYPSQIQEFLTIVPEPRMILALGLGLIFAFFITRRAMTQPLAVQSEQS